MISPSFEAAVTAFRVDAPRVLLSWSARIRVDAFLVEANALLVIVRAASYLYDKY